MDKTAVISAYLARDLTDSLDKRLTFDIADSSADFGNDYVRARSFAYVVYKGFYFVGDVRNNLNGLTEVFAVAFLI